MRTLEYCTMAPLTDCIAFFSIGSCVSYSDFIFYAVLSDISEYKLFTSITVIMII